MPIELGEGFHGRLARVRRAKAHTNFGVETDGRGLNGNRDDGVFEIPSPGQLVGVGALT